MAKVAAMIPVLLGSTRVPDKNIILVDGRVLCSYTIGACKDSGAFDEVFLNSEDEIFRSIAETESVGFHPRPAGSGGRACTQKTKSRQCDGGRCVINEHYLYDFMHRATDSDYVCQVNSTSPLLKPETIAAFVDQMVKEEHDTFFAVTQTKAESFIEGEPISFDRKKKCPSQELVSIDSICWAIAGWKRQSFIDLYERDDPAEEAAVFGGSIGIMPIDEREALDIDEWSTLVLVENLLIARRQGTAREWKYLDGRTVMGG